MKKYDDFQVTKTGAILLVAAVIFLIFSVLGGVHDANSMLKEKEERFSTMDISELGEYIVSKNSMTNEIDAITSIRPTTYKNKTLTIVYDVKDGLFYRMENSLIELEKRKKRIQKELVSENCSKSAHKIFLEKGGVISYLYYLSSKEENTFLFSFEVDKRNCGIRNSLDIDTQSLKHSL